MARHVTNHVTTLTTHVITMTTLTLRADSVGAGAWVGTVVGSLAYHTLPLTVVLLVEARRATRHAGRAWKYFLVFLFVHLEIYHCVF